MLAGQSAPSIYLSQLPQHGDCKCTMLCLAFSYVGAKDWTQGQIPHQLSYLRVPFLSSLTLNSELSTHPTKSLHLLSTLPS